jgi:sugar lactone lactonase YvrE
MFDRPVGIAIDGGNLYVADTDNYRIRKIVIATGEVTTLAGNGMDNHDDGTGTAARLSYPSGIAADGSGNLYVAQTSNDRIRKIAIATGEVTTLAGSTYGYADGTGTAAQFNYPFSIAADRSGNLYVADTYNNRIRKIVIATGAVTTLAGSGVLGYADGLGTAARFNWPSGITIVGGKLYVADADNHRIRMITP